MILEGSAEVLFGTIIDLAEQGRFEEIRDHFDPSLRENVSAATLKAAWTTEIERCGPVLVIATPEVNLLGQGREQVTVEMTCRSGALTLMGVVSAEGSLLGIDLQSHGVKAESDLFFEEAVEIGSDPWRLPGTLTVPRGPGPFPAVVLAHGSGPLDRDESIGPNKPFCDLAWGLAASGFAVLRYEKRTRQYPEQMAALGDTLTVMDETIIDVGEAVAFLLRDDRIRADSIFALGHSLSGYLMPRILQHVPALAGAIFWAAACRPLAVVMVEQIDYIAGLAETSEATRQGLMAMRQAAELIPEVVRDKATQASPMGVPASYWRDLAEYHPEEAVKSSEKPLLVMQGEADYQVTLVDFALWQQALQGHPDATFKSYPRLNHCFIEIEGAMATPNTYTIPGHVADGVVADIAQWLIAHQSRLSR
jgi:fermentation-respiration switch protein FrsA (DUF1100 family)